MSIKRKNKFILISLIFLFAAIALVRTLFLKDKYQISGITNPVGKYTPKDYVISSGSRDKKVVALTFDADMTPSMKKELEDGKVESWYNEKVVQILTNERVPATIFLTGLWMETYPKIVKELAANPLFELGNHSYSHPTFLRICYGLTYIPDSEDKKEVEKTQELLKDATGLDNYLFRFPGGCFEKSDATIVHNLGLDIIGWDVKSDDGSSASTIRIINNVLRKTKNGSIILMHLHGGSIAPNTDEALLPIIKGLKEKGYSFVKVSDLIGNLDVNISP
jgi:peptidoglycan/xylan/chitin deacetylase (PgdA/CDA1 family)